MNIRQPQAQKEEGQQPNPNLEGWEDRKHPLHSAQPISSTALAQVGLEQVAWGQLTNSKQPKEHPRPCLMFPVRKEHAVVTLVSLGARAGLGKAWAWPRGSMLAKHPLPALQKTAGTSCPVIPMDCAAMLEGCRSRPRKDVLNIPCLWHGQCR